MTFRVPIAGGHHFTNYPALRAALDVLLANRLPEAVLLTAGCRCSRPVTPRTGWRSWRVPDFCRFPADAEERRDAFLVGEADAVVVVWADRDPEVRRMLELVQQKRGFRFTSLGRHRRNRSGCAATRNRRCGAGCRTDGGQPKCKLSTGLRCGWLRERR
jgi:hypothetical protein